MTKDTHHDHYNEDGKEDPVAKSWVQEKGLTCHGRDDEQRWKNLRGMTRLNPTEIHVAGFWLRKHQPKIERSLTTQFNNPLWNSPKSL